MGNDPSDDPVVRLALRIARRADAIAAQEPGDADPWLRAEEEILGVCLPKPGHCPLAEPCLRSEEGAALSLRSA